MTQHTSANYTPAIFDVRDVDEARRIILTAEAGTTTDERWAKETPWLAERILDRFPLTDRHVVIDFEGLLARSFVLAWRGTLPREIGGDVLPHASFLAAYRNPGPAAMAPTQL